MSTGLEKYNAVVFGIFEQPKGTPHHSKDIEFVTNIFANVHPDINNQSVHDCVRIGKFDDVKSHITFNRSCDVSCIISNSFILFSECNVSVRRDLTYEERRNGAPLREERQKMIETETKRSLIKVRGNRLFIRDQLQGSVVDSKYTSALRLLITMLL